MRRERRKKTVEGKTGMERTKSIGVNKSAVARNHDRRME